MHVDLEGRGQLLCGRDDVVDAAAELEPVAAALVDGVVAAHCIRVRLAEPGETEPVAHLLVGRRREDQIARGLEAFARQ